jgi:hypothetical protein
MVDDPRIARGHISTFPPQHLSNLVWAVARLNLHSGSLYDATAMLLLPQMDNLADKGLAELANVYTRRAVQATTHAKYAMPLATAKQVEKRVSQGRIIPNALSETLWALWTASLVEGTEGHVIEAAHARALLHAGAGAQPVPVLQDSGAQPRLLEDLTSRFGLDLKDLAVVSDGVKLEVANATHLAVCGALKSVVSAIGTLPVAVRLPALKTSARK